MEITNGEHGYSLFSTVEVVVSPLTHGEFNFQSAAGASVSFHHPCGN